ncbi:serine/threonine protein kinase [Sesbania bispinosa]|nr:serine/threonine protein kinase [Sesbania bispinosa]
MIFQPGRKGKAPWPQRIAPSTNPLDENGAASKNDCLGHGTLWPQRTMTKFAVRCEEEINPLRRCHHRRSPLPPRATSVSSCTAAAVCDYRLVPLSSFAKKKTRISNEEAPGHSAPLPPSPFDTAAIPYED